VSGAVYLNSVAWGILRRMVSCWETGDQVSSLPLSSSVGTAIVGRTDNASGRCNIALTCSAYAAAVQRSIIAVNRGMSSALRAVSLPIMGGSHSAASATCRVHGPPATNGAALRFAVAHGMHAGIEQA